MSAAMTAALAGAATLPARFKGSRATVALAWLVPMTFAGLVLGLETNMSGPPRERAPADTLPSPAPVEVALLPEFAIAGGADARRETVERTLFNPTRRPAPPQSKEGAKPAMQRGQFVLTGTAVSGGTTIAFLREANGGKPRTARPGDVVNGLTVAEVRPDRVRLTLGDESEEVVLRVAAGPKTTTQPAVAPLPGQPGQPGPAPAAAPAVPAAPGTAGAPVPGAVPPSQAPSLLERRRAARAAAAASQGEAPPSGGGVEAAAPGGQPSPTTVAPTDPRWAEIYNRMMQRKP